MSLSAKQLKRSIRVPALISSMRLPTQFARSVLGLIVGWMRSAAFIIGVSILALGAIAGGLYGDPPPLTKPSNEMANNYAVRDFVKAVQVVEENYAITPDKERLTHSAVQQMLHTLDPHSNFFDRREFTEMQDEQSSRFYGIGVTINQRHGRIYVLSVSPGMPAERAGLRYGDAIIAVDDNSTKEWTQADALKYVRGEKGTEVKVTVERAGEPSPLTVNIVRGEVPFPSVRNAFLIRPGTGYIGLTGGFNEETTQELREAINQLNKQGIDSLILDLRRNPGGLLKQAIQVSETFLPAGAEIVSIRSRKGRDRDQVYRSSNPQPETMPLVLMIDQDTASASEIVAAAMQDHHRAVLVGEESFGKGLVQTVYPLWAGTGLTLTTAKYFTPNGRSIQRPYSGVGFYNYFAAKQEEVKSTVNPAVSKRRVQTSSSSNNLDVRQTLGGIKPDVVVKLEKENTRLRDACFEFSRLLVAGQIPGEANYRIKQAASDLAPNTAPDVNKYKLDQYKINDQVLAAFRTFLREHTEMKVTETQLDQNPEYAQRRIQAEILTALYGIDASAQFLMESDQQTIRALEEISKAKRLLK